MMYHTIINWGETFYFIKNGIWECRDMNRRLTNSRMMCIIVD